jgi:hypothetical protein
MVIAIFERKVRSGRGANRAVTKAQQANIDSPYIKYLYLIVKF